MNACVYPKCQNMSQNLLPERSTLDRTATSKNHDVQEPEPSRPPKLPKEGNGLKAGPKADLKYSVIQEKKKRQAMFRHPSSLCFGTTRGTTEDLEIAEKCMKVWLRYGCLIGHKFLHKLFWPGLGWTKFKTGLPK